MDLDLSLASNVNSAHRDTVMFVRPVTMKSKNKGRLVTYLLALAHNPLSLMASLTKSAGYTP